MLTKVGRSNLANGKRRYRSADNVICNRNFFRSFCHVTPVLGKGTSWDGKASMNRHFRHSIRRSRKPYRRTKHEVERMNRYRGTMYFCATWRCICFFYYAKRIAYCSNCSNYDILPVFYAFTRSPPTTDRQRLKYNCSESVY